MIVPKHTNVKLVALFPLEFRNCSDEENDGARALAGSFTFRERGHDQVYDQRMTPCDLAMTNVDLPRPSSSGQRVQIADLLSLG